MSGAQAPISVLMPVRNGQRTIRVALESIVVSMGAGDEILVIDDGSDDDTANVLREFRRCEPRLRVIRTSGVGLVGALNMGLREVSHRWVARADADDIYPPGRLLVQRQAVAAGVVLVSGDYLITSAGRVLGNIPGALTHPFVAASLVHPQRIPHPGVLMDREAVLSVGAYRHDDFPAEDLGLWLRLARAGKFVGVPWVTVFWEMRGQSVTHSHQRSQRCKVAELLKTHYPAALIRDIDCNSLQDELEAYQKARMATARRVLLARDLFSMRAHGVDRVICWAGVSALTRTPLRAAWATGTLAAGQVRRAWVRQGFTH